MIYDLLKEDHRKMLALFERVMDTTDRAEKTRTELLSSLTLLLLPHAKAEERVLYSVLRENKETHDMSLEAIEEHHVAERLLKELAGLDIADEHWIAKMEVLRESIEHHLKEEEKDLFPKAKDVLTDEQAQEMGEAFLKEKEKLVEHLKTASL